MAKAAAPVVEAPDVIGDAGRARVVAGILADLQEQMARTEGLMIANGHGLGDPCGIVDADSGQLSYGDRQSSLREAQVRVVEAYQLVMPEVVKLLSE
jgi:hypothetical protein